MMFNFSIKESLNEMKEKNYDSAINKTIDVLNDVDEYQIKVIASTNGIKLNNLVRLNFDDSIGFRCFNIQQERYGRLPICRNVEKFLNERYKDSFVKPENVMMFLKSEISEDYNNWEEFVDNQKLGDSYSIVYKLEEICKNNDLTVDICFGELEIENEYYNNNNNEYIDRFAHHWVEMNGRIIDFSKGTVKEYIQWNNLYSVESEVSKYPKYHKL